MVSSTHPSGKINHYGARNPAGTMKRNPGKAKRRIDPVVHTVLPITDPRPAHRGQQDSESVSFRSSPVQGAC